MLSREKGSQGSVKTIGIIGGIGPESTIEYYRSIIALYGERIVRDIPVLDTIRIHVKAIVAEAFLS
jgi:aspartate/glutamate racemase